MAEITSGSFGLGTGMTGNDLGVAPTKPDALLNLVDPFSTYQISMSGAKINNQSWDEFGDGLGTIEYGYGM